MFAGVLLPRPCQAEANGPGQPSRPARELCPGRDIGTGLLSPQQLASRLIGRSLPGLGQDWVMIHPHQTGLVRQQVS